MDADLARGGRGRAEIEYVARGSRTRAPDEVGGGARCALEAVARRGLGRAGRPLPGVLARGHVRYEAPFDYIKGGLRPPRPLGAERRLRHHRGRHRAGPHRARLRRGRLPARRGVRDDAPEPGPPDGTYDERVTDFQGKRLRAQPGDRRGARRGRAPLPRRGVRALLPALLALRHAAPLLRQVELVHPHDRGPRPDARRERADRLAPRAHQARALRPVAREQRRLGALARALLGHAAAGLALPGGCEGAFCAGSLDELRERGGEVPDDLHRPYIDEVVLACTARAAAAR